MVLVNRHLTLRRADWLKQLIEKATNGYQTTKIDEGGVQITINFDFHLERKQSIYYEAFSSDVAPFYQQENQ